MKKHLSLLGFTVRDRVTGITGVVTAISFELYGCIQALVNPGAREEKPQDSFWFDAKRLVVIGDNPVMEVPDFEDVPGGQALPQYQENPSL